jgi:hypothetical protein
MQHVAGEAGRHDLIRLDGKTMHNMKLTIAAAILGAVTALSLPATADDKSHAKMADSVMHGELHLSGFWTRAMLPGQKVGGGYLVIANNGSGDDRLVAVSTPLTDRAEIHEMTMVDDIMKMRPLTEGLAIPAGETVALKPGGMHLMFMAVGKPFQEGDMVPVTVTFEKAGDVNLMLPVMAAGTRQLDHSDHGN